MSGKGTKTTTKVAAKPAAKASPALTEFAGFSANLKIGHRILTTSIWERDNIAYDSGCQVY